MHHTFHHVLSAKAINDLEPYAQSSSTYTACRNLHWSPMSSTVLHLLRLICFSRYSLGTVAKGNPHCDDKWLVMIYLPLRYILTPNGSDIHENEDLREVGFSPYSALPPPTTTTSHGLAAAGTASPPAATGSGARRRQFGRPSLRPGDGRRQGSRPLVPPPLTIPRSNPFFDPLYHCRLRFLLGFICLMRNKMLRL
ncbi:hypothetical protein B296_00017399 [Ensete ventricosum]|uniref:Uncharacterized protein n=1 Tax=Ensete ventricosum TaxID=4639 RepID=A0A426ZLT4_ENSVE|nr:hypothetical protein B296_00017399 [Ensete ventricosum]